MTTIAAGASLTLMATIEGQTFYVSVNGGGRATVSGAVTASIGPLPTRRALGPFLSGQSVTVLADSGDVLIEYGDATPTRFGSENLGAVSLDSMNTAFAAGTPTQQAAFQSSVSGGDFVGCLHCDVGTAIEQNASRAGYTWQQTIIIPAGVDAVEIGLLSEVADVSTYSGVKVGVQTTTGNSPVNPPAGSAMIAVKFNGAASPEYAPGTLANPTHIWSDVTAVAYRGDEPHYLIIRQYYPPGVAASGTYIAAQLNGVTRATKLRLLGATGSFYGTRFGDITEYSSALVDESPFVLPVLVRLHMRSKVPVIWQMGDSTRQYYGDGGLPAFDRWAVSRTLGGAPVCRLNQGITGQSTGMILQRLKMLAASGKKASLILWEVASPNDGPPLDPAPLLSRAYEAITVAKAMGAKIMLDGPYPMTQGTPSASITATCNAARAYGLAMAAAYPGVVYYADYSTLHDPASFGKWAAGLSIDNYHPTEAGVVAALAAMTTALAATGI